MDGSGVDDSWVARCFVGREAELARIEAFLSCSDRAQVLLLHGPGGIGKSSLLAAVSARGAALGFAVTVWTGEQLTEFDVDITELGEVAASSPHDGGRVGHVLIVDGGDDRAATWRQLRVRVANRLHPANRLIVTSRLPPERSWHTPGWDRDVVALALQALTRADSRALLHRRGITEESDLVAISRWARGHPLALALAADVVRDDPTRTTDLHLGPDLAAAVERHVIGLAPSSAAHRVLGAAAFAPDLDEAAIAAAVPDVDPRWADTWLRTLSFITPYGAHLRMHDSVRGVIATAFESATPDAALVLRRNLADHYLRRGIAGEPRALIDLSALIRDPELREGLGQGHGRLAHASAARPEEYDELMELSAYSEPQREGVRRWFEEAPEHIVVARDSHGALVGWVLAATLSRHPVWVDEDRVLGPWFAYARLRHPAHDAFFPRDLVDLGDTATPVPATIAWGHAWFVRRLGISHERYCYAAALDDPPPGAMRGEWLQATGHVELPELMVGSGSSATRCWHIDHGEGGFAALIWRQVYRDLGLAPPHDLPLPHVESLTREALRHFHDSTSLAASSLARGAGVDERSAYVRRVLRDAIARSFGRFAPDHELRRVLEHTYLTPGTQPREVMAELSISRATYYRRLDEAVHRVAARLE